MISSPSRRSAILQRMTTTTTPHKIPHQFLIWATGATHAVMVAGAVALYLTGKIDAATFTAIMAGFGGAYATAAGLLVKAKGSEAVTPTSPATLAASDPAASHTITTASPTEPT
jgi:hypothetical protein